MLVRFLIIFAWLFSILTGVSRASEIGKALLNPSAWQSNRLPGEWTSGNPRNLRINKNDTIFGIKPYEAIAKMEGQRVQHVTLVYFEEGRYFTSDLDESSVIDTRELSSKEKEKIKEDAKKKQKQIKESREKERKALPGVMREIESKLTRYIRAHTGSPGFPKTTGSGALKRKVTSFRKNQFKLDLEVVPNSLIHLTITDTSLRPTASSISKAMRQEKNLANVMTSPNGDVIVKNIPTVDQGSRGYCWVGCVTMISRYHGLNLDIDLVASKAGYKEGDVENANTERMLRSVGTEGKLFIKTITPSIYAIKREIDKGQPIIVSRYFTRDRDAFHTQYAKSFKSSKDKKLKAPEELNERSLWPSSRLHGSHASVIVGYNQARDEVIFTESWGSSARERRMSMKELKATSKNLRSFAPSAALSMGARTYTPPASSSRKFIY